MKTAVCTKVNHIEIQEWPVPRIDRDKVLVKVSVCGICGSDLAAWQGSGHKKYPYVPGHEFCGVIEKTGAEVVGFATGERIVIDPNLGCGECSFCRMGKPNICDFLKTRPIKSNGGLAQYVALDYRMLHHLPDEIDDDLAPFIEPLSCAIHAARTAAAQPGEKVIIFGGGLMGTLTAIALRPSQAEVVLVEPAAGRRESVGRLLGIKAYSPSEMQDTDLPGTIDMAIECSGNAHALSQAIKLLRKAGRIVLAGLIMDPKAADISLIDVTTRELEIRGVWLNPNAFDEAIRQTIRHKDILRHLTTKVFRLDDIVAAFQGALEQDVNKVFVKP